MTEQTKKCAICGLTNAGSGEKCGPCLDIYLATMATVTVLDSAGVEEKHLRAALAAEIFREYMTRQYAKDE